MAERFLVFAAIAAALAGIAVSSSADARGHHGLYRQFGYVYGYAPWSGYAPRYGYAGPRQAWEYPFHGRIDSNLNPDRQMVGIND